MQQNGLLVFLFVATSQISGCQKAPAIKPQGKLTITYGQKNLLQLDLATGTSTPVLNSAMGIVFPSFPSWAPDRQKLVLSQYKRNVGTLVLVDLSRGTAKDICGMNLDSDFPGWSPDGKNIAFLARVDDGSGGYYRPYLYDFARDKCVQLSDKTAGPYRPSWSPDSGSFVFSDANSDIYEMRIDGGGAKFLISGGVSPTWSPDGRSIVYRGKYSVFMYDLSHKVTRRMLWNLGFNDIRLFAWSPDSQYIAYQRLSDSATPVEVLSIDGQTHLEYGSFGNLRGLAWID